MHLVRQEGGRVLLDKVIDVAIANQSEGGKRVLILDHGRLVDDISPQDLAE